MAVLEEDRDTLRELAIGEKVTNRTLIRQNLLAVEKSMQAKAGELSAVSEHLLTKTKELETGQSVK
ncbi:hypothetical protein pipiens_000107, partial [Culex pipiens pipiens]